MGKGETTSSAVVRLHLQVMAVEEKKNQSSEQDFPSALSRSAPSAVCVGPGVCNCQGKSSCRQQWFSYSEDSKIEFLIRLS